MLNRFSTAVFCSAVTVLVSLETSWPSCATAMFLVSTASGCGPVPCFGEAISEFVSLSVVALTCSIVPHFGG